MADAPELSLVLLHADAADDLAAHVGRCRDAASALAASVEVVLVCPAGADVSAAGDVTSVTLDVPGPRFRAIKAGLGRASGRRVVVVDREPERAADLVARTLGALDGAPEDCVALAVATPPRASFGRRLLGLPGAFWRMVIAARSAPRGSHSFCAMPSSFAQRASRARLDDAELGWVLAALGARLVPVPYDVVMAAPSPPFRATRLSGVFGQTLFALAALVYFLTIFAVIVAPPSAKRNVAIAMIATTGALILAGAGVQLSVRRQLGAALRE